MPAIDRTHSDFIYQQVTDFISDQITSGALQPGDRLPSLRRLSDRLSISVPTVRQAYVELGRAAWSPAPSPASMCGRGPATR
jgi:DNA-binding transcriptional regulator YhcF (GntR family)